MKKNIFLIFSLFGILLFLGAITYSKSLPFHSTLGNYSFIGVNACRLCHKTVKQGNQYDIWRNSKHSKAFATLLTDEAAKIARDRGFKESANEVVECLRCHASGFEASDKKEQGFKIEDGVQCETCHGAGSDYKDLKIMKNRELAIKNGLVPLTDIEKFCRSCHNSASPTFKSFNFEEAFKSIEHKIPKN